MSDNHKVGSYAQQPFSFFSIEFCCQLKEDRNETRETEQKVRGTASKTAISSFRRVENHPNPRSLSLFSSWHTCSTQIGELPSQRSGARDNDAVTEDVMEIMVRVGVSARRKETHTVWRSMRSHKRRQRGTA